MGSSHMCRDTPIIYSGCGGTRSCKLRLTSCFSFKGLFAGNLSAACLWRATFLLALFHASYSVASEPLSPVHTHATGSSVVQFDPKAATSCEKTSDLINQHVIRISASDLESRLDLERRIQSAAFQQFDSNRTGKLYNVSVPGLPLGNVRAIRLRSGSFYRYGVDINEFAIPRGCIVAPIPERILLVYAQLVNTSLFQAVPTEFALVSAVLSVHVYDAVNLSTSQPPQLRTATTKSLITIKFPESSNFLCAEFANDSTDVHITNLVQGVCQVDHLGTFALVSSAIAPMLSPSGGQSRSSSSMQQKRSDTWKIVVGSVVGGLTLLAAVSLLAVGIGRRRKDVKLSRMEYQADEGETLQMTTVRNSRVPAAANTRTQATLVNEYAL